jgi:nucleoside-diphosphate-sugar epimerase
MPHTVVTGANSFVAAQVIATLISQGHTVTGSVRRKSAGDAVLNGHPEWQEKIDFIEIHDYAATGIWDEFSRLEKWTILLPSPPQCMATKILPTTSEIG